MFYAMPDPMSTNTEEINTPENKILYFNDLYFLRTSSREAAHCPLKYFQAEPNSRLLAEHQLREAFAVCMLADQHIWQRDTVREIDRMLATGEEV